MTCKHAEDCALYPKIELTLRTWKTVFCEGAYERCARYQLALAGKPVPITLLPNGKKIDSQ